MPSWPLAPLIHPHCPITVAQGARSAVPFRATAALTGRLAVQLRHVQGTGDDTGNGCFSNYAGTDGNLFRRTRCRENICVDQGRGAPLSGGLMWAGKPGQTQTRIEQSSYFAPCDPSNIYWPGDAFAVVELTEEDFTMREAVRLDLCWE